MNYLKLVERLMSEGYSEETATREACAICTPDEYIPEDYDYPYDYNDEYLDYGNDFYYD